MLNNLRRTISNIIYPRQKNSMSLPNQFLRYGKKAMQPDWTQVVVNDEDMYTGYGYASIRNRANAVARNALEHIRTKTKKKDYIHPYLDLITSSKTFSDYSFWYDISTFLDLEGIFYLMAIRNVDGDRYGHIQEFKLLSPYEVRRVVNHGNTELGGYMEFRDGMQREIPKELIIEIRELNPFSRREPFALADAAKEAQFDMKTAGDYTRHSMKHNINAPGIITTDVVLPQKQFENFVARVKGHVKGEEIFGNGPGAIKWQAMNVELSKAALKDVNEINRQALFSIAGTSLTIMGIEQSGTTRDTAKVQKELFIDGHIIPRIQIIIDALNQDYQNNYSADFSRDEAEMYVFNPTSVDYEAEEKNTEVKISKTDLYLTLIDKGYDEKIAASYVEGDIEISDLGKPKNLPKPVETKEVFKTKKVENQKDDKVVGGAVLQQEGALRNSVTNIQDNIVSTAISRVAQKKSINQFSDDFTSETELITKEEKKSYKSELELVLAGFFGIIIAFKGKEAMTKRIGQFGMGGNFTFDRVVKSYIRKTSKKTAKSHIDTIASDLYKTARDSALEGKGQNEIINDLKQKYSNVVTETRAKTIARTETNRAFTMAQYEADVQFIKQNDLTDRVFKQWRTRSDNPCPFCLKLESQGKIPFFEAFAGLGDNVEADGKKLPVNFEEVVAGNLHPNCSCIYEIIIDD